MNWAWLDKNLHAHTTYSDGANSMEEMARRAVDLGFSAFGFTDHSHTFFDESYCMPRERYEAYAAEAAGLKRRLAGTIDIRCGVEQDLYSDDPTDAFEYAIGSVHYVRVPGANRGTVVTMGNPQGEYLPVDETPEILALGCATYFDGDYYALAEEFFATAAQVVEKTGCGIIGHFDLVKRFNAHGRLFDESHPRYVRAWQAAADALLDTDATFEVNVRAFRKGQTAEPYPSRAIRDYLTQRGAMLIPSSDAHAVEDLETWDFLRDLDA